MKTIASFICVAFALLLQAQAVVPAPDGVSLDDNPSLALQNDAARASLELARRETGTVLTFEERVSYQRAIEEVYWRHRIWPKERPDTKPALDAVMSQAQLEKKSRRLSARQCHPRRA